MEFDFVKMNQGRDLLTPDHSDSTNILLYFRLKLDALMGAAVRIVTILLARSQVIFYLSLQFFLSKIAFRQINNFHELLLVDEHIASLNRIRIIVY